jgi:3-oxoacyl-[acyl-carrier protein] reductase
MDLGLTDRRVLVTGASRGLGAAIAAALAGEGARVVVAARASADLSAFAESVGAVAVAVDLADPDGPRGAVEEAVAALGGLDGLVVNSGGPPPGVFREQIPGLITSNVLRPGLAGLIKTLADEIAPIRINGIAPGRFSTARIRSLDETRAKQSGMTVEDVELAMRARIPLGRYGDPAELGRIAAVLVSPAASYVDGQILGIDGGMIRSLP